MNKTHNSFVLNLIEYIFDMCPDLSVKTENGLIYLSDSSTNESFCIGKYSEIKENIEYTNRGQKDSNEEAHKSESSASMNSHQENIDESLKNMMNKLGINPKSLDYYLKLLNENFRSLDTTEKNSGVVNSDKFKGIDNQGFSELLETLFGRVNENPNREIFENPIYGKKESKDYPMEDLYVKAEKGYPFEEPDTKKGNKLFYIGVPVKYRGFEIILYISQINENGAVLLTRQEGNARIFNLDTLNWALKVLGKYKSVLKKIYGVDVDNIRVYNLY